jgi:hypothetical protein
MNETKNVAMFAATLLHSATNTHFFHWATNSYSQHKALGNYYFPSVYHQPKEPLKYLESLKNFVAEANSDLPQKQELINIVAEIQQLIDSTIYKLKYLK